MKEEQLQQKSSVLSVSYLESNVGKKLPSDLQGQYKIDGNDVLSDIILSPRAHNLDGSFMACESCFKHIAYHDSDNPQNLLLVMVGVLVKFQTI